MIEPWSLGCRPCDPVNMCEWAQELHPSCPPHRWAVVKTKSMQVAQSLQSDPAMTGLHLNATAFLFLFLGCVSSSSWCTGFSCCGAQASLGVQGLSSCGVWDLSSLTRDRTCVPFITRQILKH